jgi:DNA polymerase III alpha subunit (gram-positive type)
MQQLMEYGGQMKEFAKLMRGETDFYGHFQPLYIDTIVLGQLALSHLDGMTSYKLEIMAEKFGIELDDAHDADADVTATTNVAMVCSQRMRNASGIDDGSMVMTKTEKSRVHFKI